MAAARLCLRLALDSMVLSVKLSRTPHPTSSNQTGQCTCARRYHSATLSAARSIPSPPRDFSLRKFNDRYVQETPSVWIKNATIWTGNDDGRQVLRNADLILRNGLIHDIGLFQHNEPAEGDVRVINANGAWVTPG